jgi:hypothetical protein
MIEKDVLYKELTEVPPVPEHIFTNIEKTIHANNYKRSQKYALAATILLSIGLSSWFLKDHKGPDVTLNPEIVGELQIAHDFINYEDSLLTQYDLVLLDNE